MDKNVLKKFAIESRQELMDKISNKIKKFYVDEEFQVNKNGEICVLSNEKHTLSLTKAEYENRQLLIKRINEITLEQVIEEAAYTWFNRIIAIRYMEIHDYLPLTKDNQSLGIRVLSSKDNTPDPEIMKISNLINSELDIEFNKDYYSTIQDNNKRFEYILLLICKKLGKVIPQVFDGITDYIDILIPDNLLNDSGYVTKLLKEITEENFEKVEIIGWLYQFYVADKKKLIDEKLNNGKKIEKNDLPTKTQIFTPEEIVQFMINNCSITNSLEELKIIDPCCGSGHILVAVIDWLYDKYYKSGYSKENIVINILEKNIFGLDIDYRAAQLSILSILLKSREYDKKIFNKCPKLNVFNFVDTNKIETRHIELIRQYINDSESIEKLLKIYNDAKEIGSIIVLPAFNYDEFIEIVNNNLKEENMNIIELSVYNELKDKLLNVLRISKLLSYKYDIVITNPPYLGRKYCSSLLSDYLDKNYPNSKMDLFSAFIERTTTLCKENGNIALMTPFTWLYLSSYKLLRSYLSENVQFEKLLTTYDGFFNDAAVTICSFILKKTKNNIIADNLYLDEFNNIIKLNEISNEKFKQIPENRFVFNITDTLLNLYNEKKIEEIFKPRQGMATTNNDLFLRRWYEVDINKIGFGMNSTEEAIESRKKWFPYNKGGGRRKWYGNNEYVVNFENNGKTIADYIDLYSNSRVKSNGRIINREYYYKKSITWSDICGSSFSARACEKGFIFDVKGSSGFVNDDNYLYILSLLNSNVSVKLLNMLNPTITTQVGNLKEIPYRFDKTKIEIINKIARENIQLLKEDWDYNETSWDFKNFNLTKYDNNLIKINCEKEIEKRNKDIEKLMENEKQLNKIFIDIYELNDEISSEINEEDISITPLTPKIFIRNLLSYSVGCMFGRYSLNAKGLNYAGGEFKTPMNLAYSVDNDNIIPIVESNYFGDDIFSRFKEFLEEVYGKENLYKNLEYIAEVIGKKSGENSEETIRRYFINDFYNEHIKMYQKRPIYWMFDSGKKNGFKCLIYLHRYNESTVSKIRLDYLHKMQNTYEKELKETNDKLATEISLIEKKELTKKQDDLTSKLQEVNEYDEKIAHIADQKISIDLDDGVVVNYDKFSVKNPKTGKNESILAKIK